MLKDYVILYCSGDAGVEEKLLGLHDSLQKHDGDMVMLRESTISVMRVGSGCYGGGDISTEHVTLSFGKISSPYLVPKFEEVPEEHKELFHLFNQQEREQLVIPVTAALTVKGEGSNDIGIQSVIVDEKTSLLFDVMKNSPKPSEPRAKATRLDSDGFLYRRIFVTPEKQK